MSKKTFSLNELFAARGLITAEELQARQTARQEAVQQYKKDFEAAKQQGQTYMFLGCLETF